MILFVVSLSARPSFHHRLPAILRPSLPRTKAHHIILNLRPSQIRGFAKFKKFQKSNNKNLDRAHPTHPPPIQSFFGNPSLTWTEHSIHNNEQLLVMYTQTEFTWYTIPKYQYWFRAIWDDFQTKKIRVRPGPTHPPTSIVISDSLKFFLCKAPNVVAIDDFSVDPDHRLSHEDAPTIMWRTLPYTERQ